MAWYEHLFQVLFRSLFMHLDLIVYTCVRVFYNLFDAISEIRLFSESSTTFQEFSKRIYVLIGVYALFKITFVLINMMVNPADGSKGEKSVGKLATRIFVSLAMIIIAPFIFEKAYELQDAIIDENVIGLLIMPDIYDDENKNTVDIGHNISNQIFSSFVSLNSNALENPDENITNSDDIDPETILKADAKESCNDSLRALMELHGVSNQDIEVEVDTNIGVSTMFSVITDTYEESETDKKEFCLDYNFLLSTIAGGFAAFIFAVYCLDIGLRTAKLAFYELVAPIPIVSYIDGKKDGPFQKWAKSTALAYADIFIRLIIINFILFLIINGVPELVTTLAESSEHDLVTQYLAKAAVILGLLMFAKQAPDLIKDMFGIKGDGSSDYGFSLKKKISSAPLATGALAAAGVGAGAFVANAGKAIAEGKKNYNQRVADNGGKKGRALAATIAKGAGSSIAGASSGALRGLKAGTKKDAQLGKTIGDQLQATTNKRDLRGYRQAAGYTLGKRLVDQGLNFIGQDTVAKSEVKSRESRIQAMQQNVSMYNNRATDLASKIRSFTDPTSGANRQKMVTEANYNSTTGEYSYNGTILSLSREEKQYKHLLEMRDAEAKNIVDETKKKKTYDEALARMERKKQG